MLHNATKRERSFAVITIFVALSAIGYNFIIEPLFRQWNGLDRKISDKEIVLKKYSRILRDKDKIEKERAQYAKYFESKKVTPDEESAIALSRIERAAHTNRVQITNIKPLSCKSLGSYDEFTFRVTTESTLDELTKFIYDIQSSDQLLKVERMVLRAKDDAPAVIKSILNITKISVF